jgi:cysteine desulfurase family protein (TIGR01976 family)
MAFTESDCFNCRKDFPALERTVNGLPLAYLDGPGGTQVPRSVIEAVSGYYRTCNANTHGFFATSVDTDRVIQKAREAMAALLGAPSAREISFGANMTSLAFALSHAICRTLHPGDEVVVTQLDHEANRGPWIGLHQYGAVVREVALRPDGTLDEADLERTITARTRLVAVGYASNALGTVNNVPLARRLSKAVGAWLAVDAVHYAPHFPLDVVELDVDFLFCSAYKFYGPHVGILYTRPGLLDQLTPDRLRTQEETAPCRIETGTLNHAALAGVTAAVEYAAGFGSGASLLERLLSAKRDIAVWERSVARQYFEEVRKIAGVTVWGPDFSSPHRAPTVSITLEGVRAADAARHLADRGLALWDGHFYALRAIEVLGLEEKGGVLRTGVSMYNTPREIDRLLAGIRELAGR